MTDKYSAVWVSHSSLRDFQECPRSYYLKNVYKNPKTGKKMKIITPPLALGQAVHEVIESLSGLPVDSRFTTPLMNRFSEAWERITGKKGGFENTQQEAVYKSRGESMIARVSKNPGPLKEKAVKIRQDLPHYWLSESDQIILCGKLDWLQYLPETEMVHIIDFKTGSGTEDDSSLQLPIYVLLAKNCQTFAVHSASYWYLERSDEPEQQLLPDIAEAKDQVLEIAMQVKIARKLERFKCPHSSCRNCLPFERILQGEGELVAEDAFRTEVYTLPAPQEIQKSAVIL